MLTLKTLVITALLYFSDALQVSTYNLWNLMFNWRVRRLMIGEQIRFNHVDVIGFQEVRGGFHSTSASQISDLRSLLPGRYRWSVYVPANNVTFIQDSISTDYPCEGVGLISSLPIFKTAVRALTTDKHDPDKNKRIILHTVLKDSSGTFINVIVLHLSYFRKQQCKNIAEVISYIEDKKLTNVIIVGDLNVYQNYEGPVKLLTDRNWSINQCRNVLHNRDIPMFETFIDAWRTVNPDKPGLTFSNMPHPGLVSRPDRILVSPSMKVKSAVLKGDGKYYKQRYDSSIIFERFLTIARASYLSYTGTKGYSCVHDCGPRGSCQCGVCVNVGKDKGCLLEHCPSCDKRMYQNLVIYTILFVILVFHLFYAVFAILIIASNSYGDAVYNILGFSCCLMSKELFVSNFQSYRRKYNILRICQIWPLFRLPPYSQLVISLIGLLCLYFRAMSLFASALDITYSILDEEYFPSDHLMLTVDIEI